MLAVYITGFPTHFGVHSVRNAQITPTGDLQHYASLPDLLSVWGLLVLSNPTCL
jgi:hypothetical protein